MQRRFRPRKKVCAFCQDKSQKMDYKDINKLKKFISEEARFFREESPELVRNINES